MKLKLKSCLGTAAAGLALVGLASCGGGTQIEAFHPEKVVVFGDEASLVNTDGTKYTVNGVVFDTTVSPSVPKVPTERGCNLNQIWVQQLAYNYGFTFSGCPTSGYTTLPAGAMRAQVASTVAMMSAEISAYAVSTGFSEHDLVTIMVGTQDVVNALSAADPAAAATAAGTAVGDEVIRITNGGTRVIVSTIPDVGVTPQYQGTSQAAQLSDLTQRFNTALRLQLQRVRDGGHVVGLVLADELVLTMSRFPSTYGVSNLTGAACGTGDVTTLPSCDQTTVTEATPTSPTYASDWLWAGPRQLGSNAQNRLGSAAVTRARNNPF